MKGIYMGSKFKKYFQIFAITAFFLIFLVIPVCLYTVLRLGFPPVLGNLLAARNMTAYAAQVHPDWTPEGGWANYNLVVDGYDLSFSDGVVSHSLGYTNGVVQDSEREEALREELEIDKTLRVNGLWTPGRTTYWSVRWPAKTPDKPRITVDVDFYDDANIPVPDEAAMREKMADEAVKAYEALSPVTPIHRFSVRYCHQGVSAEHHGNVWNIIRVDLPEGKALTRENILSEKLDIR